MPDHDLDDPDYVHRASRVELSELVHALCVSGRGWTPDRVALAKAALANPELGYEDFADLVLGLPEPSLTSMLKSGEEPSQVTAQHWAHFAIRARNQPSAHSGKAQNWWRILADRKPKLAAQLVRSELVLLHSRSERGAFLSALTGLPTVFRAISVHMDPGTRELDSRSWWNLYRHYPSKALATLDGVAANAPQQMTDLSRAVMDAFEDALEFDSFTPPIDLLRLLPLEQQRDVVVTVLSRRTQGCLSFDGYELDVVSYGLYALDLPLSDVMSHLGCTYSKHQAMVVLNPGLPVSVRTAAIDMRAVMSESAHKDFWWRTITQVSDVLDPELVGRLLGEMARRRIKSGKFDFFGMGAAAVLGRYGDIVIPDRLDPAAVEAWVRDGGAVRTKPRNLDPLPLPVLRMIAEKHAAQKHLYEDVNDPLSSDGMARLVREVDDLDVELRCQLARRGSSATQLALLDDPEIRVRQHVARSGMATRAVLAEVLKDPSPQVRSQLGRNPRVTHEVLVSMSRDEDERVRTAAGRALLKAVGA